MPAFCSAQTTIDFAVTTPILCRFNTYVRSEVKTDPFGATGVGIACKVSGVDENALSFVQNIGLNVDRMSFNVAKACTLYVDKIHLDVNPGVLVPSKWASVSYYVGFGGLITLTQGEGSSASTGSNGITSFSEDSVALTVNDKVRKFVPYLCLGVAWRVQKHCTIQLQASQTLLNYFDEGAHFGYSFNYTHYDVKVSSQPAYIGLRFYYYF